MCRNTSKERDCFSRIQAYIRTRAMKVYRVCAIESIRTWFRNRSHTRRVLKALCCVPCFRKKSTTCLRLWLGDAQDMNFVPAQPDQHMPSSDHPSDVQALTCNGSPCVIPCTNHHYLALRCDPSNTSTTKVGTTYTDTVTFRNSSQQQKYIHSRSLSN